MEKPRISLACICQDCQSGLTNHELVLAWNPTMKCYVYTKGR